MTREDPTGEWAGPGGRRRLGEGGTSGTASGTASPSGTASAAAPVIVTVLDRAANSGTAAAPLDGRVLDTAEVRALSASGLGSAAPPTTAPPTATSTASASVTPTPPYAQQRDPLDLPEPERGKDMATKTTRTHTDTAVAPVATNTPAADPPSSAAATTSATATFGGTHFVAPPDGQSSALTRARYPRADQELRERPAFVLPGWLAGPALLAAVCAIVWAVAASGHIDSRLPDQLRGSALLDVAEAVAVTAGAVAALLGLVLLLGMFVVPAGSARVMSRYGRYKGTVRRTGLVWAVPFRRRRKVDTRLRHWRSRPMDLTDRQGTPLHVMVLVVWQVRDTARARFAVRDHEQYLRQQIEAAVSAVSASLPCDSFTRGAASLRDTEHVNDELTRRLSGAMTAAGVQVFSAQALHIDYAPQVADSMLRRRIAALDAATRTAVLDDVVDTVSQAVDQFTRRALVRLDEDGRTDFIRDLTVAMYTARGNPHPTPTRD
ncbi:SPFH domain-containing protein [Yinghuangia sp. YIM S09857]|uniref:SPFH domain-containing protein n=1 Tax=Yinghuangia sp. YIM S09857 TaxID=3436929 RepID=UPI003F529FFD